MLRALTPLKSGKVFPPLQVPGLVSWYEATDGTTFNTTTNAANISRWNDKSGNGYHLLQATSTNQPTYASAAINGKPGILFTKTSVIANHKTLITAGSFPITGNAALTVLFLYQPTTTDFGLLGFGDFTVPGSAFGMYNASGAPGTMWLAFGSNNMTSNGTYVAGTPVLEVATLATGNLTTANVSHLYKNGVAATVTPPSVTPSYATGMPLVLGRIANDIAGPGGGSSYDPSFGGYAGVLGIYTGVLTGTQLSFLYTYMNTTLGYAVF